MYPESEILTTWWNVNHMPLLPPLGDQAEWAEEAAADARQAEDEHEGRDADAHERPDAEKEGATLGQR